MKKIVISGVTSGLGAAWLAELDKRQQAEFFVLARNKNKLHSIIQQYGLTSKIHFVECDLSVLKSIDAACQYIFAQTGRIDVLVNNAGIWSGDTLELSDDNIEMTFAVNVLAPYYLTGKLLPLLHRAKRASIVNTASFRHSDAKINKQDIELVSCFNAQRAYCNSKLYTILFTKHLAKLLSDSQILVNSFDPGMVDTPMLRQAFPKHLSFLYPLTKTVIARSVEKAAQTGVFLCDEKNVITSGAYFKDKKMKRSSSLSYDQSVALWLWCECERLSGFVYSLKARSMVE